MTDRRRSELLEVVHALAPIVDAALGSPDDGDMADAVAVLLVRRMEHARAQAHRRRRMARGSLAGLLTADMSPGGEA